MAKRFTLLACAAALILAGCASAPAAEETLQAFTSVTEEPEQPDATSEFDAALHPDPIVEPLECTPYLVITARGTGEPHKGQLLSPVARAVSEARPGQVQLFDLDYPADDDINVGGALAARTLIDTLNVQAAECDEQRFLLLGYSQGALILGDAIANPDTRLVGAHTGELTEQAADRVLAVVLYGNPRFNGNEPYNFGDYTEGVSGILPRLPGTLDAFADRLRDYCVRGDFVCQAQSFDLDPEPHAAYYSNGMQQDGAAFAINALDPLTPKNLDSDQ